MGLWWMVSRTEASTAGIYAIQSRVGYEEGSLRIGGSDLAG